MTFPVTEEQLDMSQADKNRIAFSIINSATAKSVGHCELYRLEKSAKIDRLIIGDSAMKGKGLCSQVIAMLLDYGFNKLDQTEIELNVFDWNTTAIRCYEKAGLIKNSDKTMEFEMDKQKWVAFNMYIDRQTYEQHTRSR